MRFLRMLASKLRGIFVVIGLVAISLLIWFVLPAVTMGGSDPFASAYARGGIIISMFVMAAVYKLRSNLSTRRRNEQMASQITQEPDKQKKAEELGKEEVEELKGKFKEAIELLKRVKTKNGSRGSYLYVLPWYVLIGPPGSGKTTALLNSSLHFPLIDSVGAAVKGVGGTRNCDWWFTDEAVLLDTAGRYTTQDNQSELDKAEWKGFLDLLKKFRKRKPINGAIIAFGVDDLLKMSESELISNAKTIKQRILELQEAFKIRFPVYVMLTKLDLIPGFNEYFEDLGREEREQVWGMTFPYKDEEMDVMPQFLVEYRELQERIQGRVLERLQGETDLERRNLIYIFPRVVGLLQDNISVLLQEVFKATRFEVQPLLRGVYFTSGTQDGTTLDRVVSALISKFGFRTDLSTRKPGKGKGYFLANLFNKVIFKESGLAGVNIKNERRLMAFHAMGYLLATVVFVLVNGVWATSYIGNKDLVYEVQSAVKKAEDELDSLDRADKAPYAPSPALTVIRNIPTGYASRDQQVAFLRTFGLYQGDKLGSEARSAYQRVLYKTLLPRILFQMEEALIESRGKPDVLYETLRAYLMLGEPKRLERQRVYTWVMQDWERILPESIDRGTLISMERHLDALLESLPEQVPVALDSELIADVRSMLSTLPLASRVYYRFKSDALADTQLQPFRFIDEVGDEAAFIFQFNSGKPLTHSINGFFTSAGYKKYFLTPDNTIQDKYFDEKWVMGDSDVLTAGKIDFRHIHDAIKNLYLDDYLYTWKTYLDDLDIVPMNSTSQTLSIIGQLAGGDSPLLKLMNGVKRHTSRKSFSAFEQAAGQTDGEQGGQEMSTMEMVKKKLYGQKEIPDELMLKDGENQVTRYFESLNDLTIVGEDKHSQMSSIIRMLDELYVYLGALDKAQNKGRLAWNESKNPMGGTDVMRDISVEIHRLPKPLSRLMSRISKRATTQTVSDVRNYMQRQWYTNVSSQCKDMVAKRYPFDKRSKREVTLDDLAAYFGPNGIVERYFDDYLIDYVDTTRRPWRWLESNGVTTGFSSRALTQVETAQVVRDTFFRAGSSDPSIGFEVRPVEMDKNILRMNLVIDGQQMSYSHGPKGGKRFRWPNPDGSRGIARLVFNTTDGQESITEHGEWALFRLFDQAKQEVIDKNRYLLTFTLDGRYRVSLELRANSVYNPFQLQELAQVRCD